MLTTREKLAKELEKNHSQIETIQNLTILCFLASNIGCNPINEMASFFVSITRGMRLMRVIFI